MCHDQVCHVCIWLVVPLAAWHCHGRVYWTAGWDHFPVTTNTADFILPTGHLFPICPIYSFIFFIFLPPFELMEYFYGCNLSPFLAY